MDSGRRSSRRLGGAICVQEQINSSILNEFYAHFKHTLATCGQMLRGYRKLWYREGSSRLSPGIHTEN